MGIVSEGEQRSQVGRGTHNRRSGRVGQMNQNQQSGPVGRAQNIGVVEPAVVSGSIRGVGPAES